MQQSGVKMQIALTTTIMLSKLFYGRNFHCRHNRLVFSNTTISSLLFKKPDDASLSALSPITLVIRFTEHVTCLSSYLRGKVVYYNGSKITDSTAHGIMSVCPPTTKICYKFVRRDKKCG